MHSNRVHKVSQRVSLTCLPCARSKVRCSKTVPCTRCANQGRPHLCSRESVQVNTRRAVIEREAELRVLQNVAGQLQSSNQKDVLQSLENRISTISSSHDTGPYDIRTTLDGSQLASASPVQKLINDADVVSRSSLASRSGLDEDEESSNDNDGLALTLEYLAWGRNYKHDDFASKDGLTPSSSMVSPTTTYPVDVPSVSWARKLVSFHIEFLCWHHNSIHSPTFLDQCESFWESGTIAEPLWLALYFSILSTAAWCFPSNERYGSIANSKSFAEIWYNKMISTLIENHYMGNHSIYSVQAIAISTLVAHPLGHSNTHYVLLSAATRIAQCLGLDKVKDPKSKPPCLSVADWNNATDHESKRRIWWQLIIQDYFAVPFAETYTINTHHFSTPMPRNCDDHDLEDVPETQPTISSYCIVLAKMARIMPQLVDGAHRLSAQGPDQQYQHVLSMDLRMRNLVSKIPPFFLRKTPEDPNWPPWVSWARQTLTISAADKIIMIHRKFLIKSFQSPLYAYTRTTCLSASITILREFERVQGTPVENIWIVPAFTISAAIIVALDLLYTVKRTPETDRNRDLLRVAMNGLSRTKQNKMAIRGASILTALLEEEQERRQLGIKAAESPVALQQFSSRVTRHLQKTEPGSSQIGGFGNADLERDLLLSRGNLQHEKASLTSEWPQTINDDELQAWFNESLSWNMADDLVLDPLKNASFASNYGQNVFGQD
ncbi:hypothetical protein F4677DRAFT_458029 [Hypoxylon crocopeplum]|nr:hypothetical protein F4677DRAFT_458029 [Hypoxylon crocopeplum]